MAARAIGGWNIARRDRQRIRKHGEEGEGGRRCGVPYGESMPRAVEIAK